MIPMWLSVIESHSLLTSGDHNSGSLIVVKCQQKDLLLSWYIIVPSLQSLFVLLLHCLQTETCAHWHITCFQILYNRLGGLVSDGASCLVRMSDLWLVFFSLIPKIYEFYDWAIGHRYTLLQIDHSHWVLGVGKNQDKGFGKLLISLFLRYYLEIHKSWVMPKAQLPPQNIECTYSWSDHLMERVGG